MSGFLIDFNPATRDRLRGLPVLLLGAICFAMASDRYLAQMERLAQDKQVHERRNAPKKVKHATPKPATPLDEKRAIEARRELAYDWNPILEELESAGGEGVVVRQFAHEIGSGRSTLRLESNNAEAIPATLQRIQTALKTNRSLYINEITQQMRDGQTVTQMAIVIQPGESHETIK
jgi:hypothetical protein